MSLFFSPSPRFFAITGNVSSFRCNPVWNTYFSGGSFIQAWDLDKPRPTQMRKDPETNQTVQTSYPCEILAHDRPEFDLIDETNPATGGIALSFSALPEPLSDGNKCPTSPIYGGGQIPRSITILLYCDPSGSTTDLKPLGKTPFVEVSPCVYQVSFTTKAACGISGDPFDIQSPVSTPGKNFGFTILGSFLTAGSYMAFMALDARGYLDTIKNSLSNLLGFSSTSYGSSKYTSVGNSFSSSSATSTRYGS